MGKKQSLRNICNALARAQNAKDSGRKSEAKPERSLSEILASRRSGKAVPAAFSYEQQLMQQISANEAQRRQRMVAALSDKTRAGPAPSSWIRATSTSHQAEDSANPNAGRRKTDPGSDHDVPRLEDLALDAVARAARLVEMRRELRSAWPWLAAELAQAICGALRAHGALDSSLVYLCFTCGSEAVDLRGARVTHDAVSDAIMTLRDAADGSAHVPESWEESDDMIGDEADAAAEALNAIQAVNLGYCSAMRGTDSLVAALAALPSLKTLSIAGCFPDIEEGPRTFRSLVQQIKGLQRIDVSDCLWFTDIEVESLYNMRLVPRLALLRLRGCVLVTRRALDALQEARPALVIVA